MFCFITSHKHVFILKRIYTLRIRILLPRVSSNDRNNTEKRFFDPTKPGHPNPRATRPPDNRYDTRSPASTGLNGSWNRVPESPYNGTPRLSINGNNGFTPTRDIDERRKFASTDRKSLQVPETRPDCIVSSSPCRGQDVVNGNGYHVNGSATKSKCDDNFFSGRRWLDFQLFSNQVEASTLNLCIHA